MKPLTLNLYLDDCPENPLGWSDWRLVSFSNRHLSYGDPSEYVGRLNRFGEAEPANIGLRRKLQVGTAFWLGYFEHGRCLWHLSGAPPLGTAGDYQWDGVALAGLLLWEGKPKDLGPDLATRRKYAAGTLQTYTEWCNGDVFCFALLDDEGEVVDACGGYFGSDGEHMAQEITAACEGRLIGEVEGNASDWADGLDLPMVEEVAV